MSGIPYIPFFTDAAMVEFWNDLRSIIHMLAPAIMILAAAYAMYRVAIMIRDTMEEHSEHDARRDHRYHDDEEEDD